MSQSLSQFALITGLVTNWNSIRLRMEPVSAELAKKLSEIAARLQTVESSDEIANIIDDLLELTRDTPAYSYVQSLVGRFTVNIEETITRDYMPLDIVTSSEDRDGSAAPPAIENSRVLGALISVDADLAQIPIFFATNRSKTTQPGTYFNDQPAREISYGLAQVTIPVKKHKIGHVESPHWWTLFPKIAGEHRFVTLGSVDPLSQLAFATRLEALLQSAETRDLLVFLHGYNVTFEEATQRAAQVAYDMKFPGAVILYSWPSAGSMGAYASDEERSFASADRFAAFLTSLEGGPWNHIHIVAHSMGNRVMLLGLADNQRPKLPLGQIVFAAADVYVPMFQEKFLKLQAAGHLPATSYASNCDLALRLSSRLHRGARVGFIAGEPFLAPQLDTIDASAVDTGFLGHGYFAEKRSLITDLRLLLHNGMPPKDRGLTEAKDYWLFPR